jgi:hypothetical protein
MPSTAAAEPAPGGAARLECAPKGSSQALCMDCSECGKSMGVPAALEAPMSGTERMSGPLQSKCVCGHPATFHKHYRPGNDCSSCSCQQLHRRWIAWLLPGRIGQPHDTAPLRGAAGAPRSRSRYGSVVDRP